MQSQATLGRPIESGLLRYFRLFLLIELAAMLSGAFFHGHHGLLLRPAWPAIAFPLAGVGLIVLALPRAGRARWILPALIASSAVIALVEHDVLLALREARLDERSQEGAWLLLLYLLMPLILASWQYGPRGTLLYCVWTAGLDLALVAFSRGSGCDFWHRYAGWIVLRTIVFAMAGLVVARVVEGLRRQRRALEKANARLAALGAMRERLATSRERVRLARELHDVLAHSLSAVAVQLEAADSLWDADARRSRSLLRGALEATRSGLTETRKAIQALRASPPEELGLIQALRSLADAAARRGGFAVDFDLDETVADPSPASVDGLYRVAQEALENVARHAEARAVRLLLRREAGGIALVVEDDGIGFRIEDAGQDAAAGESESGGETGFGLRGMRERAELAGGTLCIRSRPGAGTRVELVLPEAEDVSVHRGVREAAA